MIRTEPVASLLLDESNPRYGQAVADQSEAINALLTDAPTKLWALAKDIVTEGSVNPTELPVVVEEDGNLVVIEGNRRLAALKLLRNPQICSNPIFVKRFQALAKEGQGPSDLAVFIADSREDAKHWIDLRHTGENDGVGVLEWASWQANNFRRRRGSQADRAALFCSAVEIEFPNEAALLANVDKVRRDRLTTLGRLVSDPHVRREFGFDFVEDGVVFYYPGSALLPGIKRVFADLAGDVGVSQIKSKDHRTDYVTDRADALPPRSERLSAPRSAGNGAVSGKDAGGTKEDSAENDGNPSPNPGAKPKGKPTPPERVIFKGLKLTHVNPRISGLLKNAQTVDIDHAPAVAAVLIRIVVELVVTDAIYAGAVNVKEGDSLKKKIRAALLALDPQCENPMKRDKKLEMAWTRSQDADGMAVQSLHAFVHNVYGEPTGSEVRLLSTTFRGFLERLDQLIAGAGT